MSRKLATAIAVIGMGALLGGYFCIRNPHARAPIATTFKIRVSPPEQLEFAANKANSPFFKYLVGKKASVRPGLTQKLQVKPVPNSSLLEAKIGVMTRDEGQKYADGFVEVLQDLCGKELQLSLVEKPSR
jgi:hypothetical protein